MAIEFEQVSKQYGRIRALDGISFRLESGDVLGYIGPNGAGKSTTMRILSGLVRQYQGRVLVDGMDIEGQRQSLHRRIGFVPQEAGFQDWRTVTQALRTFGRLSGLEGSRLDERVALVLGQLDLEESAKRVIRLLSGGLRQRLRFAQALLHDPDILILDEPLNGLDPASRHQLRALIKLLADGSKTIIFSSHILNEMEDLANRIAILHHGQILRYGSPDDLRAEHGLGSIIAIEGQSCQRLEAGWFDSLPLDRIEHGSPRQALIHLRQGVSAEATTPAVMGILAAKDFSLSSLRILQPSLEDMYLRLTSEEPS